MNPILLSDWLPVCAAADVEAIPAEVVLETTKAELMQAMDGNEPSDIWDAIALIIKSQPAGPPQPVMYRWDCCSPGQLKYLMGQGLDAPPSIEAYHYIDDPRLWDIVFHWKDEAMRLYRRPWIPAVIEAGYPVEFRAFVAGGVLRGVSSYYPQRPLGEKWRPCAEAAGRITSRLLPHTAERGVMDFSADFLVRASDQHLLFLEGGPPHLYPPTGPSAHPCCFAEGKISGIALESQEGALDARHD